MHTYSIHSSPDVLSDAITLLRHHLPRSLPLYRRLQFGHFTSTSSIITSLERETLRRLSRTSTSPVIPGHNTDQPWLLSFSDPDRGPETQIHLFATWETLTTTSGTSLSPAELDLGPRETALLRAWIAHIAHAGMYRPTNLSEGQRARLASWRGGHLAMLGSVHERSARALVRMGLLDPGFAEGGRMQQGLRMPVRYAKWIFDLDVIGRDGTGQGKALEEVPGSVRTAELDREMDGLRWAKVRPRDYVLVRGRTSIPRQDSTLSMLPSVAAYPMSLQTEIDRQAPAGRREHDGERMHEEKHCGDSNDVQTHEHGPAPIAWAFLGVDASLTSLHVEPEYRGRGYAKQLARRLWETQLAAYDTCFEPGRTAGYTCPYTHADVAEDNASSNGVCRSLGGEVLWWNYWLRLDLDQVARLTTQAGPNESAPAQ